LSIWRLNYEDYRPRQEKLREALCTLGNGYFATRGAGEESQAGDVHYPGTYLAGGYNRRKTEIAGHAIENEDLVNLPNWLPVSFRIEEGPWIDFGQVALLDYCQTLELRQGILRRRVRFRDDQGRITHYTSRRLVHMNRPHIAALHIRFEPENWSGNVQVRSALDGRVINDNVPRYRDLESRHLEPLETREIDGGIFLRMRTNQSRIEICQAAKTRVGVGDHGAPPPVVSRDEAGYIAQCFDFQVTEGQELAVEKVVALFTSRDPAISECGLAAVKELSRAQATTWLHLWKRFDLELEGPDEEQTRHTSLVLHLHLFHMLQTTSPNIVGLDVGVPARGLHGEAYRGHIFWDEMFIFPTLNVRMPEITRALLGYRYRRLDEARAAAREAGFRGAMYPWQSGSDGREESQVLHLNPKSMRWVRDHTHLQRHVNAAIAYNIWQHYQATDDREFLSWAGAEMLLEIARFFASLATYNRVLDRYEICKVMGPDEYHDRLPGSQEAGLDNNAYTNVMATWVLCRALELLDILPEERLAALRDELNLADHEIGTWNEISRKLRVIVSDDGIISQFEGYQELQEFDWAGYRERYGNIQRLDRILEAEGDTPNAYKVSKQADVLMLFYLFSAEELAELFCRLEIPWRPEMIPANVRYYLRRTPHGSTLSHVVHAWVLARSDRERAWELFSTALDADIADIQGGTTPEGIHLGAMAGTVDLVQRNYMGLETRGNLLLFNPCLPTGIHSLCLTLRYRKHSLMVKVTRKLLRVTAKETGTGVVRIAYGREEREISAGRTVEFDLRGARGAAAEISASPAIGPRPGSASGCCSDSA